MEELVLNHYTVARNVETLAVISHGKANVQIKDSNSVFVLSAVVMVIRKHSDRKLSRNSIKQWVLMNNFPNQEIFERDNWTCQYCGLSGVGSFEQWNRAWFAIDHVTPKKHGGTDDASNLVVSCHACNSIKGANQCCSVEEGREIIARKNEERKRWYEKYVTKVIDSDNSSSSF